MLRYRILVLLLAGPALADDAAEPVVCNGKYALCTSAPCVPDPLDPKRTICECEVTTGMNFAFNTCLERKPIMTDDGYEKLKSTYGFVQASSKPVMTCPQGTNWSDCLGVACTVDPRNPLRAICSCKLATPDEYPEDYVTYGGDCNTLTCDTAVWSAATIESFAAGTEDLLLAMKLKDSPVTFCAAPG